MGQYREWLFYREIDQQLTTQIQAFEQELAQIQAEIGQLEHKTSYTDNIILQALIGIQQAQRANSQQSASNATGKGQKAAGTVSPALFAWSQLPKFDGRDIQPSDDDTPPNSPLPPLTASTGNLLPTDISAFVDAHSQTDPQLKVPWWLRSAHANKMIEKDAPGSTSPVDQQSTRTNQLVERWFERWGERTKNSAPKQEGQAE
ncbi:hypothetical protein [Dictyobacter formicarum]|uniref:Uncharacterized protein n=1 Tax=Dictyobacter formicarum TaxID=2778368 RepID=A0ABQ3VB58_9CHLR|nr:hypothetical protein [Dictyobacter formicarum]GHO83053.1 hypothetical protein KSZ_10590 [Dictyobacter formicarum]